MIKKRITYLFLLSALLLISIVIWHSHQDASPAPKSQKKFLSPAEMRQATIDAKIERRSKGWSKPDKPSEFMEFHRRIRTPDGNVTPEYRFNYRFTEFQRAKKNEKHLKSASALNWQERGPGNVSGRTRGLIIDPDDPNKDTWFAGSVGGGIWKTTNAGESWVNLTPDLPVLSTVCLTMAASKHDVIYAGTGEGFGNVDAITGNGIFKSTDRGDTWTQLMETALNDDFSFVNRIIVHPENENYVLAATNTSIQLSEDGGNTWKNTFDSEGKVQQLVAAPNRFDTLFAAINNRGILRSVNGGKSWQYVLEKRTGRHELAIAPSKPSVIYALDENSALMLSEDGGNMWMNASVVSGNKDAFLGGQGWYNNTLSVDPEDPYQLIIGGIDLYNVEISGTGSNASNYFSVDTIGTAKFLDFVNFGGNYMGGGMDIQYNKDFYRTLEIQFGKGKTQKAHRFVVPEGSTSGVPNNDYAYQDYVEVPFQAWDTGNNRQLMVSFRDQDRNGQFNLSTLDDTFLTGREYIWINDVSYAVDPSARITSDGQHQYEEVIFIWPVLSENSIWDAKQLPNSKIVINRSERYRKEYDVAKLSYWNGSGSEYVHADMHNIQRATRANGTRRVVVANDGGVSFSDNNLFRWNSPLNGYNTSQFYGVDKHPFENRYIGGMQDNGSWFSPPNPDHLADWKSATGGDGFDAVWHAFEPEKMITSIYNNSLYLSIDGGKSWQYISSGFNDSEESSAPFITQIGYSTSAPDNLYIVGASGVSYSKNFGRKWETAKMDLSTWGWFSSTFDYGFVEPSLANPNVVWAGTRMSSQGQLQVSLDGGESFVAVSNFEENMGQLSGLATHPTNDREAFALFSFQGEPKILRTYNLGESWHDISGYARGRVKNGFPDVATYSLFVMPNDTSVLWAGTEIGLFISEDNGNSWYLSNNSLPAVSLWEIKQRGSQIILATHGRGIWTVDLPGLDKTVSPPLLIDVANTPTNRLSVKYQIANHFDSLFVVLDSVYKIMVSNTIALNETTHSSLEDSIREGEYKAQLWGYYKGSLLKSTKKEINKLRIQAPEPEYETNFEDNNEDFSGNGFQVKNTTNLQNGMAIHSPNPYPNRSDLIYYLKKPIIIADENQKTVFSYEDIPMIEEGEPGSIYGEPDFYDYVIAEGSTDGHHWQALLPGYDFRSIKVEAAALGIKIDSEPDRALFQKQEINLSELFEINDTILIRFRLFSDPLSNGWGWVIDNINIERIHLNNAEEIKRKTSKIYPNPAQDFLTIDLGVPFQGAAEISVYNMMGHRQHFEKVRKLKSHTINTSMLKGELYILEIRSGNKRESFKFEVKR